MLIFVVVIIVGGFFSGPHADESVKNRRSDDRKYGAGNSETGALEKMH